jgi:threonine synthase
VTVSDEDILLMMRLVGSLEGMFLCPEGAATAVAARDLLQSGSISEDDDVLLLNTGTGLKYLDMIS